MVEPDSEPEFWPSATRTTPAPGAPAAQAGLAGSPLIEQTDAARRRIPGLVAAALAAVLPLGSIYFGLALSGLAPAGNTVAMIALASLGALGPLLLAAWVLMVWVEGRPARSRKPPLIPSLAIGGLIAAVGLAIALCGPGLVGHITMASAGMTPAALAVAAGLVFVQAAGEEAFFRGWLLPIMTGRWGAWVGLAASSLLFAGPHFIGSTFTPVAMLNDTLAGVVFGLLALRTGGLAAPIAAHFVWNFTEAHVLGAFPNPGIDPLGSILNIDFTGPALMTGGDAALNGALSATVALGLMAVAAYVLSPRPRPR